MLAVAGDAAPDLVPRVVAILDELAHALVLGGEDSGRDGARCLRVAGFSHPELSDDVIATTANAFTYDTDEPRGDS